MNTTPLSGLKILVTRPRDQAMSLAQAIEKVGGIPIVFPLLDIAPISDTRILYGQLARLAQCDMAIFISPNAVRYGMAAIAAAGGKLPPQVATIGKSSASALSEFGIENIIAPTQRFDSEGLLEQAELTTVAHKKIMILRGDGGRELLGDTLKMRGASVEYAECYQRGKAQFDAIDLLREMPDVITVTSSEALAHLHEMVSKSLLFLMRHPLPLQGGGDVASKSLATLTTPLFVPHPRIAALARQQGWGNIITTETGDDGLLASLLAWRNTRGTT
jgi:uroporphyrinogen-III synthase